MNCEEYLTRLYNNAVSIVISDDLRSDLINIMNEEHQFLSSVYRTLEHRGLKKNPLAASDEIRNIQQYYTQKLQ